MSLRWPLTTRRPEATCLRRHRNPRARACLDLTDTRVRNTSSNDQIGGNYGEPDAAGRSQYIRLPDSATCEDAAEMVRITRSFTMTVLGTIIRCVVRSPEVPETIGVVILQELRAVPQLRFDSE